MIDIYARRGERVALGREGTRGVRRVIFDYTRWRRDFGEGVVQLIVQRPGEKETYPIALVYEDDLAIWELNSADTAVPGEGKCEWQYYVGDKLEKSEIYTTIICDSLADPTDEPPDSYDVWLEALLGVASEAELHRRGAEAAEQGAQAAQGAAEAAANKAEVFRDSAATQANEALKQAQAAAQSVTEAEAAESGAKDAQALAEAAQDAAEDAQRAAESVLTETKNEAGAAARSAEKAATSEKNAATSQSDAAQYAKDAKASEDAAAKSEAAALKAKEDAENLVGNADWIEVEIDENGILVFTHSEGFTGADFALNNDGELEVMYT